MRQKKVSPQVEKATGSLKRSNKSSSSSSSSFLGCLLCFKLNKVKDEEIYELDYAHCSLKNVPQDIFTFERTLETLHLECNMIQDLPRQLFHCQELKVLNISDNDVKQIPPAISSLTQLTELYINKNYLTDIPDTIKQLKHLNLLDASTNPLLKIPEGCTQLLNITELYLNDTFMEFLPANFGRLVKLKILELRENNLNDLPRSLSRLINLQRLDLGQNDFVEIPEVIGTLVELREFWIDGNRVNTLPDFIQNLRMLNHFDLSFNHFETLPEALGGCKSLELLILSTNDLISLPESLGQLSSLVTLKADDNQIEQLPQSIGKCASLEELIANQNYLTSIPSSIGLCRKLHTLNISDNDIDMLPSELGSCISLKILNAHANKLTTLPAEMDHITDLAVVNLTANMIQYLPVSFMKLRKITALWLSENQTKPLVQLNQDTDPETGQRVLTNFLLPQQPEIPSHYPENNSDESFHHSTWEARKTTVRWAGEDKILEPNHIGSLRREPTPFPKEMRAMAKRVQNMRAKTSMDAIEQKHKRKNKKSPHPSGPLGINRAEDSTDFNNSDSNTESHQPPLNEFLVREAKISKPQASPVLSEPHIATVYKDEAAIREQIELKQFEELEKSFNISVPQTSNESGIGRDPPPPMVAAANNIHSKFSPEKNSRDSGVITPSDSSMNFNDNNESGPSVRKPSDPLPQAPISRSINNSPMLEIGGAKQSKPPPYHIAAVFSKQAKNFNNTTSSAEEEHSYENHTPNILKNPNYSDTNSISGQSEVSTATSSLQTVVKSPLQQNTDQSSQMSSFPIEPKEQETVEDASHANKLRKVSEQLLANPRTRQSVTGIPILHASNSRPASMSSPRYSNNLNGNSPQSGMVNPNSVNLVEPKIPTALNSSIPRRTSVESNGLLNTIEKAAHSDEEESSMSPLSIQPNYENVSTKKQQSRIPHRVSSNVERLSTANFVVSTASKVTIEKTTTKEIIRKFSESKIPPPQNRSATPNRNLNISMDSKLPLPSSASKIPKHI